MILTDREISLIKNEYFKDIRSDILALTDNENLSEWTTVLTESLEKIDRINKLMQNA